MFAKSKILTSGGKGTIPDGIIVDFKENRWFILEVDSALIFAREVGAVDTLTYMQVTGEKRKMADSSLDSLQKMGILTQKGKTLDAAYYVLNLDYEELAPQVTPQVDINHNIKPDFKNLPISSQNPHFS